MCWGSQSGTFTERAFRWSPTPRTRAALPSLRKMLRPPLEVRSRGGVQQLQHRPRDAALRGMAKRKSMAGDGHPRRSGRALPPPLMNLRQD